MALVKEGEGGNGNNFILNNLFVSLGFLAGLCGGETADPDTSDKAEKTLHMDMTCKINKTG